MLAGSSQRFFERVVMQSSPERCSLDVLPHLRARATSARSMREPAECETPPSSQLWPHACSTGSGASRGANTGNDCSLQLVVKDLWVRNTFRNLSFFLRFYSRLQLSKLQRSLFNERRKSFTQTCCFQGQRIEAQECFHDNITDYYISEVANKKKIIIKCSSERS